MSETVDKKINNKSLLVILSIITLVLSLSGFALNNENRLQEIHACEYPVNSMMIWSLALVLVAVIFMVYIIKGKRIKTGAIPAMCVMWSIVEVMRMPMRALELIDSPIVTFKMIFNYFNPLLWIEMVLFVISLVMILICANIGFRQKKFFGVFCFIGIMIQFIRLIRALVHAASILVLCNRLFPLVLLVTLLIFGLTNRTLDEKYESKELAEPQGSAYRGVYIPPQSVAQSGRTSDPYIPPQNVAYVPPVTPDPAPQDEV